MPALVGFGLLAESEAGVCIGPGQPHDTRVPGRRVPPVHHRLGPIQDRRQRLRRSKRASHEQPPERGQQLVAPFTVCVEPLQAIELEVPGGPLQRVAGRAGVRRHARASQAMDVLEHGPPRARQRIGGWRGPKRHEMSVRRVDLDGLDAEDAEPVAWRRRNTGGVPVVGDDDELQPGARGRGGDLVQAAGAIGRGGVDVVGAANDRALWLPVRRGRGRGRGATATV